MTIELQRTLPEPTPLDEVGEEPRRHVEERVRRLMGASPSPEIADYQAQHLLDWSAHDLCDLVSSQSGVTWVATGGEPSSDEVGHEVGQFSPVARSVVP